jgi:hypothetical protein
MKTNHHTQTSSFTQMMAEPSAKQQAFNLPRNSKHSTFRETASIHVYKGQSVKVI